MLLSNGIHFRAPRVPSILEPHISWSGHCSLTDEETLAFYLAFLAFSQEFTANPRNGRLFGINILLLNQSDFTIILDAPDTLGHVARLIILPLHRWREFGLNENMMIISILEELCHMFYLEDDEIKVESLVLACYQRLVPTARLEDVYNLRWSPDDVG